MAANLLGYVPLGALAFVALLRSDTRRRAAPGGVAVLAGAALSFAMELLQNYLPQRVPSNVDLALNAAGAALGAVARRAGQR